jgi:membrane protease YdiL (CAAX protease family)
MDQELKTALLRVLPFLAVFIILVIRIRSGKINTEPLYLKPPRPASRFFLWVFGFLTLVLAIEFIFYQLGMLEVKRWNHPLLSSIIRITGAVILAPIVEELVFRGFFLGWLVKRINRHLAIFIQACVFVLLHNYTYQFTFATNFGIFQGLLDASLYAYAKYNTKSIYTPIAMHMSGNLVATLERFIF